MPISCCTARNRRKKRVRGNPPEPPTASRVLKTRLVGIVYLNKTPKEHILNSFGCLFFMLTVCVAWFIVCICFGFASAARKNRMLFLLKFSSTFFKRLRWGCKGRKLSATKTPCRNRHGVNVLCFNSLFSQSD